MPFQPKRQCQIPAKFSAIPAKRQCRAFLGLVGWPGPQGHSSAPDTVGSVMKVVNGSHTILKKAASCALLSTGIPSRCCLDEQPHPAQVAVVAQGAALLVPAAKLLSELSLTKSRPEALRRSYRQEFVARLDSRKASLSPALNVDKAPLSPRASPPAGNPRQSSSRLVAGDLFPAAPANRKTAWPLPGWPSSRGTSQMCASQQRAVFRLPVGWFSCYERLWCEPYLNPGIPLGGGG